jgi:predicted hotdog family 3-hydroxylacyl-ACP dehydratase
MDRPTTPETLDHAGIAARVPHAGAMCLLERLLRWSGDDIVCSVRDHDSADHPLRLDGALPAAATLELASQAMALHGALAAGPGAAATPGFLASARDLALHVPRLNDRPGPLQVHATRLAGDRGQAIYRFELHDAAGALLAEGRATVVLDRPLALAGDA